MQCCRSMRHLSPLLHMIGCYLLLFFEMTFQPKQMFRLLITPQLQWSKCCVIFQSFTQYFSSLSSNSIFFFCLFTTLSVLWCIISFSFILLHLSYLIQSGLCSFLIYYLSLLLLPHLQHSYLFFVFKHYHIRLRVLILSFLPTVKIQRCPWRETNDVI